MKRILVVDDIEQNLYFLHVLLEGHGYRVEEARNGAEAVEKARARTPDMVISDILMPVMDGFSLCRIWKTDSLLREIPFVFYTATYTDPKDERLALELGADDFIIKPTEPDELLRRIGGLLLRKEQGAPVSTMKPVTDDEMILRNYNEALIRKLEKKTLKLEQANNSLEKLIEEKTRVEKALRESELHYRTLADSGSALIWTSGVDKKRDYFNRPWLEFTGRSLERELDDGWLEGVHPDDLRRTVETYLDAFYGRDKYGTEYRLLHADGGYRWVQEDGNPRFNGRGDFIGYIGHCMDITDRKRAEEQNYESRSEMQRLLGEAERSRRALLSVVEDQKITEKKLEDTLLMLEERVAQRTAELEKARIEAVAANRAKTRFLSSMSHEIRTPLNAILGFSQLLLRETTLSAKQREPIEIINRSGEHLLTVINDILEFSKIEAGRLYLNAAAFNLHDMLLEIELMFKFRTDSKKLKFNVEFTNDIPKYIMTDQGKLRQILINLLGNAVKFTAEGGIRLRVKRGGAENGKTALFFEVEDTGHGISSEDYEKLFLAFSQTEAGSRLGGTGLGLALSLQYARLLGGDIRVSSEPGHGSIFTLSIAVREENVEPEDGKIPARRVIGLKPGQGTYRVLVVDDSEDNRALVRELLTIIGFEVEEAADGRDALEKLRKRPPNIVLMDMRMPGMDGYRTTMQIKEMKEGAHIPVIAVTASAFEEEREKAFIWGVDGYMRKPFKDHELFECIRSYLKLEYIYEGEAEPSYEKHDEFKQGLFLKSLKDLPETLIDEMLEATVRLDQDALMKLIQRVDEISIEAAVQLRALAKKYEYELLISFLKQNKAERSI